MRRDDGAIGARAETDMDRNRSFSSPAFSAQCAFAGLCTIRLRGGRSRAFKLVVPAKAGIQVGWRWARALDSRFRGNDEWELARFSVQRPFAGEVGKRGAPPAACKAAVVSAWKARLYRWRWWLVAVAVVIAARVALPEILRRVLISQASKALHAQVEVGDVDLFLLHGDVALKDVSIREATPPPPPSARRGAVAKAYAAEEAPAAGGGEPPSAAAAPARSEAVVDETPAEASPSLPAAPTTPQNAEPSPSEPRSSPDAPEATPTPIAEPGAKASPAGGTAAPAAPRGGAGQGAEESPPIIAFKRFAVSLHYLPLFSHTVRLREVVLDSPRVDLKRLSSGSFNILALVPTPGAGERDSGHQSDSGGGRRRKRAAAGTSVSTGSRCEAASSDSRTSRCGRVSPSRSASSRSASTTSS